MDTTPFVSLLTYLFLISSIAERVAQVIKIHLVEIKPEVSHLPTIIFAITFVSGGALTFFLPTTNILILGSVNPILLPIVVGLLTVSGSGLWHDLIGLVFQLKEGMKPVEPETKTKTKEA